MAHPFDSNFKLTDLTPAERNAAYLVLNRYRDGAKRALASLDATKETSHPSYHKGLWLYYTSVVKFINSVLPTLAPKSTDHSERIKAGIRRAQALREADIEGKGG